MGNTNTTIENVYAEDIRESTRIGILDEIEDKEIARHSHSNGGLTVGEPPAEETARRGACVGRSPRIGILDDHLYLTAQGLELFIAQSREIFSVNVNCPCIG